MPAKQRAPRWPRASTGSLPRLANYTPELNDIERDWKAHHLAPKTFNNWDSFKATIDADIEAINSSRKSHPLANQRIAA